MEKDNNSMKSQDEKKLKLENLRKRKDELEIEDEISGDYGFQTPGEELFINPGICIRRDFLKALNRDIIFLEKELALKFKETQSSSVIKQNTIETQHNTSETQNVVIDTFNSTVQPKQKASEIKLKKYINWADDDELDYAELARTLKGEKTPEKTPEKEIDEKSNSPRKMKQKPMSSLESPKIPSKSEIKQNVSKTQIEDADENSSYEEETQSVDEVEESNDMFFDELYPEEYEVNGERLVQLVKIGGESKLIETVPTEADDYEENDENEQVNDTNEIEIEANCINILRNKYLRLKINNTIFQIDSDQGLYMFKTKNRDLELQEKHKRIEGIEYDENFDKIEDIVNCDIVSPELGVIVCGSVREFEIPTTYTALVKSKSSKKNRLPDRVEYYSPKIKYEKKMIERKNVTYPILQDVSEYTESSKIQNLLLEESFPKLYTSLNRGTLIRVFLYKGEVYYATRRKINFKTSKFGKNYYTDVWKELGGPIPEELFGEDYENKLYSPYVYFFLIISKKLFYPYILNYTEKISFIGVLKCWELKDLKADIDFSKIQTKTVFDYKKWVAQNSGVELLYNPEDKNSDFEEINNRLFYGNEKNKHEREKIFGLVTQNNPSATTEEEKEDFDPRLFCGEPVLVQFLNQNKGIDSLYDLNNIKYVVKLNPNSWRESIRGFSVYPTHSIFVILKSIKSMSTDEYVRKFPLLKINSNAKMSIDSPYYSKFLKGKSTILNENKLENAKNALFLCFSVIDRTMKQNIFDLYEKSFTKMPIWISRVINSNKEIEFRNEFIVEKFNSYITNIKRIFESKYPNKTKKKGESYKNDPDLIDIISASFNKIEPERYYQFYKIYSFYLKFDIAID